jgi:NAD(P) transhydrogenase subunit alpha
MRIAVVKENRPGERRVAFAPETVKRFRAKGADVAVESGAGERAGFPDEQYREAGASIEADAAGLLGSADLVVHINVPDAERIRRLRPGAAWISLLFPLVNKDLVGALRDAHVTAIALDRIPRTTIAQSMDVLSSQSTCAGYAAVIEAARELPKLFPLFMTAAGRIDPARVLILGAGVAGLQAIGIARRLGAVVEAYDVRAAVKEQVESLGAKFVDVGMQEDAETKGGYAKEVSVDSQARINEVIAQHLADTDVCITTALIPGRPAPRLLTADMVKRMRPGSVVVDLAAEQGGNCELTKPGERVVVNGITILGPTDLASRVPLHASQMFSRNLEKLINYISRDGKLEYDFAKEIVRGSVVTHEGKVVDEQVATLFNSAAS